MTTDRIHWRPFALASGEDPNQWARALAGDWRASATLIKGTGDGSGVEVWFAEFGDRHVVVKLWPLRSLKRRVQALFRATPGCRHWKGAAWLLEHELPTAEPLALLRSAGTPRHEALVMQRLPGRTLLEWMADDSVSVRLQHTLARITGGSVARLLSVGFNRDHKPSNLIVIESEQKPIDIAIIDCVAIRPGPVLLEDVQSELAMLVIEALGCGVIPRQALRMRALKAYLQLRADMSGAPSNSRGSLQKLWHGISETVEAHGDPRPKIDPLERTSSL